MSHFYEDIFQGVVREIVFVIRKEDIYTIVVLYTVYILCTVLLFLIEHLCKKRKYHSKWGGCCTTECQWTFYTRICCSCDI